MNEKAAKREVTQKLKSVAYRIMTEEVNTLELDELDDLTRRLDREIQDAIDILRRCEDY